MATLLLSTSCGKDDEVTPEVKEENPEPGNEFQEFLTSSNENTPLWEIPSDLYDIYENIMSIQVTLQEVLLPYSTESDLMCVTIDDDIRAVVGAQYTGGELYFPLTIAGNSGSRDISIHYYCSKLQRTYTVKDWKSFTPGIPPTDNGKPYVPEFIPGAK